VQIATSDAQDDLESAVREPSPVVPRKGASLASGVTSSAVMPFVYQDLSCDLPEQILEAGSQQQGQSRVEVSGELEEKADLGLVEEGIFDATAVLALPEKYRERRR